MADDVDEEQELCAEFVVESREMIGEVEPVLVELESEAESAGQLDLSQIDAIFRAFHSMKGSGGFLELNSLVAVTHEAESLLDLFRKGKATLEPRHITLLCRVMDFISELLDQIEAEFNDAGREDEAAALVEEIQSLMSGSGLSSAEALSETQSDSLVVVEEASFPVGDASEEGNPLPQTGPTDSKEQTKDFVEGFVSESSEGLAAVDSRPPSIEEAVEVCAEPSTPGVAESAVGNSVAGEGPTELTKDPTEDAPAVGDTNPSDMKSASASGPAKKKSSAGNIRVDLGKLDALMDLVGELILAETMVTHNPDLEGHHFEELKKASLQLNRITRAIQDVAMSVRMVPIAGTFRKMLRVVRDLSQKQSKQVDLVLVGEETEIDKTVVEAIADPLVHLIRNSVDHGIEMPEDRERAGKSRTGTVRLEAKHQGGEIWITIDDDGKGLSRDAILEKAIAKGLLDGNRPEPSDQEIYRFIFAAGFSTALQVTDVSGRGVGMDVVRRNIDELGGRVDIDSRPGQGSTITIRLPLTLAIVEGMLARVGKSVYAIPLLAIRESVTATAEDVTRLCDGQEMVSVRDRLLPVLRIHDLHEIHDAEREIENGILVIVEDHGDVFAILVDELIGQRQIVIKALPAYMNNVRGVSGCSILSSGDISLILDIKNLNAEWQNRGES